MGPRERKSLLCPNCRKLISSSEEVCPYCATRTPASMLKRDFISSLLTNPYDIIKIIISVNAALYILTLVLDPASTGLSGNPLAFLSPSSNSLLLLGATGTYPIGRFGSWWTLLSACYLHGGILHILFNMLALRQIGPLVIHEFGVHRFFAIYTITGIVGFFLSWVAGVSFTIGASASVCGLIGATLFYGKARGGSFGTALFRQVLGWLVIIAIFGFIVPGINNWAHGGGAASGIVLAFLLGYNDRNSENHRHRFLAMGCVGLTVTILLWAILRAMYYAFTIS
ncbi:MAG: rhomboid family intramembrane serine protease [Syntrophales bacterium]|nr:rhomboid family intramembrane serine protease [Syntrophales bacterium]MCK9528756.1 rhomboid family intramembrane serine protease [Syntrophales bacterium]MDX9922504.1 rhomboid family intramembrane serine protease [Syntrophales bacterium]